MTQDQSKPSTDRTGVGYAAAAIGCIAAAYFSQDSWPGVLASFGIVAAVLLLVALSDLGTPIRPWHRAEIEWQRFKSYALGTLVGWATLVWLGLVLANASNMGGLVIYLAPAAVLGVGIFGYVAIGRRVLRRRLLRKEFKVDP